MKFCGIRVKSNFFLAPMAGVTSLPFRLLCKQLGAGLTITEQVNATQIARNPNPFTNNEFFNIKSVAEEKPVGAQLFGVKEDDFKTAVEVIEKNFDFFNVNCGCPAPREMSIGAGAALLNKPQKIASIIRKMKEATKKPVTIKIRLKSDLRKTLEVVKMAEDAGVDAVMVHGRTAEQGYSGKADWQAIKVISSASNVPIVSNGDVVSGESAWRMLEETNTSFGLVGRQAMINPFIFKEIIKWRENKEDWKPSEVERINAFFDYYNLCKKFDMVKLSDLKLKATLLTKGIMFTKQVREKLNRSKSVEEITRVLKDFKERKINEKIRMERRV